MGGSHPPRSVAEAPAKMQLTNILRLTSRMLVNRCVGLEVPSVFKFQ